MNHVFPKFFFAIVLLLQSTVHAQAPANIPLPNGDFSNETAHWSLQTKDKEDTSFGPDKGALRISRKRGAYFLRAYRDVIVAPDMAYEITFRIKVQGAGYGSGWIIIHTTANKWLEDAICFSPAIKASDWQTVPLRIPASANMDKLRLNFAPRGQDTTIWLDDVTITAMTPEKSEFPLISALQIRPKLDGKLNDGFWRFALKLDDFRVLGLPDQRAEPKTQVMLAVYQDALWIAYHLDEPNPQGIRTDVDKPNDIAIYTDDCAETFISVDQKRLTQFDVSALGHYAVGGKEPLGTPLRTWYDRHPGTVKRLCCLSRVMPQAPAAFFPGRAWASAHSVFKCTNNFRAQAHKATFLALPAASRRW